MGAVTRAILFWAATNECFCLFNSKLVRRAKSAIGSIYAGIQDRDLDFLSPTDFELQLLEVFEPLIRLLPPIIRLAHALEINVKVAGLTLQRFPRHGCLLTAVHLWRLTAQTWHGAVRCPGWHWDWI